jgi:hypothetical protein
MQRFLLTALLCCLTACGSTSVTDYQTTSVAQQNTVIALLQPSRVTAQSAAGSPTPTAQPTASATSTPATPTPTPAGPEYLATVVAQNATLVARADGAGVPLQQTVVAQNATLISGVGRIGAAVATQSAFAASQVRLQQTANAISDYQAVQLHSVRDSALILVNQQATQIAQHSYTNALQATSIAVDRAALVEQRAANATAIAVQRGQTQLLQTQVALQATIVVQSSWTEFYTCLTARDTHPALTCPKPKK